MYNIVALPRSVQKAMYGFEYWYFKPEGRDSFTYGDRFATILQTKVVHMWTHQVPSTLSLRNRTQRQLSQCFTALSEYGFPFEALSPEGKWVEVSSPISPRAGPSVSQVSESQKTFLSSLVLENERFNNPTYTSYRTEESVSVDSNDSDDREPFTVEDLLRERIRIKEVLTPFELAAVLEYHSRVGSKAPKVFSFPGDTLSLKGKIPSKLTGSTTRSRSVEFHKLKPEEMIHVVEHQTYWGKTLMALCRSESEDESSFGKSTLKMLRHFLEGKGHPKWSLEKTIRWYGEMYLNVGTERCKTYQTRSPRARANRLLQVLVTVDGVIAQKMLASPEVVMTWEKYDYMVVGLISRLLPEEFMDGEIHEEMLQMGSVYNTLKDVRNEFKEACGRNGLREFIDSIGKRRDPIPKIFLADYRALEKVQKNENLFIQKKGYLAQKRGCGTPSQLQALRDELKFCDTVTVEPEKLSRLEEMLIKESIKEAIDSIPDEAVTGLSTKAGIRASSSACYEASRREGGNIAALNEIVFRGQILKEDAFVFDLETGDPLGTIAYTGENPGEYVFWRCVEEVLATDPIVLGTLKMLSVKAPSKVRIATKGHICLKVALDFINGVCSWVLSKAFPTSTSGMEKENHAWNFSKELHKMAGCFVVSNIENDYLDATTRVSITTYKPLFVGSTDFTAATDRAEYRIGQLLAQPFMSKVGVPPILQGVVMATCLRPRKVEFRARGYLSTVGAPVEGDPESRFILTKKGIMQGDPLTKVILHLSNVCIRLVALKLTKAKRDGSLEAICLRAKRYDGAID